MDDDLQIRRDFALALARDAGQTVETLRPGLSGLFDRALWSRRSVRLATNCYSFVLGDPRIGIGVPGHLLQPDVADLSARQLTIDGLGNLLLADGLEEVSAEDALRPGSGAIVAAIAPSTRRFPDPDEHFWHEENGLWLHKPFGKAVSGVDRSNNPITNPLIADRGPYRNFVGFFKVPADGIPFVPKFDLHAASQEFTRHRP